MDRMVALTVIPECGLHLGDDAGSSPRRAMTPALLIALRRWWVSDGCLQKTSCRLVFGGVRNASFRSSPRTRHQGHNQIAAEHRSNPLNILTELALRE